MKDESSIETDQRRLSRSTVTLDLEYQGRIRYIAACLLDCGGKLALLDPGPSCTLPALRRKLQDKGVSVSDIQTIVLTHIHFDHAGATGSLVKENPRMHVLVHQKGAAHLIDPTRLLSSASRVIGSDVEEVWGTFQPVPAANLQVLVGGENIELGMRRFEALYTPGHAIHHVSYFEAENGIAFVGDAAGIRISDSLVYPATPPPDIDLEQIDQSLDLIQSRKPHALFLTHFGLAHNVDSHMAEFRERLQRWSEFVRLSLRRREDNVQLVQDFSEMVRADISSFATQEEVKWFESAMSPRQNWHGLARYWRQRENQSLGIAT